MGLDVRRLGVGVALQFEARVGDHRPQAQCQGAIEFIFALQLSPGGIDRLLVASLGQAIFSELGSNPGCLIGVRVVADETKALLGAALQPVRRLGLRSLLLRLPLSL